MKEATCCWIVVLLIIGCILWKYFMSDEGSLKCIVSNVDGNIYCVRERIKLEMAADLLAKATNNCKLLIRVLKDKFPDDEDVERLASKFDPTAITETLPTSTYTAYSENKGEKLAFCLNKKKGGDKLIDLNTLTFVAIHELAHIMTVAEGHGQAFWENFKFLLVHADTANIYNPVDYKNNPIEFCSLKITDNPFYDM